MVSVFLSLFLNKKIAFRLADFEKVIWLFSSKKQRSGKLPLLSEKLKTHIQNKTKTKLEVPT